MSRQRLWLLAIGPQPLVYKENHTTQHAATLRMDMWRFVVSRGPEADQVSSCAIFPGMLGRNS
jgi:hypothetical protein